MSLLSFIQSKIRPEYRIVPGATLTYPNFDYDACIFSGAVYASDGSLVLESLRPSAIGHWRPIDPVSIGRSDVIIANHHLTAVYGGHFFTMWGHFLLETLSTALHSDEIEDGPVIFAPFAPGTDVSIAQRDFLDRKEILEMAGWGGRKIILQDGPMRVDRLTVPERLCVIAAPDVKRSIAPEMVDVYDRIREGYAPGVKPSRRVVAMRPDWFARRHPEEGALYEALRGCGYHLMNGAAMSVREQVETLATATELVGFTGSNLHNSVFCHPGTSVIEFADVRTSRASATDYGGLNRNQIAICDVMHQPLAFVETFRAEGIAISAQQILNEVIAHNLVDPVS